MARDAQSGLEVIIERDRAPEPKGPEEAVVAATRKMIGADPNGRTPEELEAIDRRVFAQSKRHARLFNLSKAPDAEAWADIQHRHAATGQVRILRVKELQEGVQYAQFVEWVEFSAPEEEVRASAVEEQEKLLSKLKPKKVAQEKAPAPKAKRQKTIPVAIADDPPATHRPLED